MNTRISSVADVCKLERMMFTFVAIDRSVIAATELEPALLEEKTHANSWNRDTDWKTDAAESSFHLIDDSCPWMYVQGKAKVTTQNLHFDCSKSSAETTCTI